MKNIFKTLIVAISLVAVTSCSDYLDVNTDPNNPTTESVSPDLMIAGAMTQSHRHISRFANRLGNIYMQNWAGDATNFTGAFQDEYALNLTDSFYQTIWNELYLNTATFTAIIDNNSPAYTNYNAIARIMKSYYFQYIVDLYGDAPYTEAHRLGEGLNPAYDDDQAIYGDLIAQLDIAIDLINNAPSSAITPGAEDVILQGNMAMWVKLANTIKLKLLIRQQGEGSYNSHFASLNGASFIGAGETVTINPGYADESGKLNPHYDLYYEAGGNAKTTRSLIVGAQYGVNFLKGAVTENAVTTGLYDNRVDRLFEAPGGVITGFQQGTNSVLGGAIPSKLGLGIISSADQDGYIMTAAESLLLQAEAAEFGYVSGLGAAKDLFQSAISESFDLLGASGASAYIAAGNNTNLIGWDGSANKLEAIMTQKWIALNGINGIETWIEYTRTGFPDVPLATTASRPARPNRLLYPATEYTGNASNVPTQTINDAFTTKIFWDQN